MAKKGACSLLAPWDITLPLRRPSSLFPPSGFHLANVLLVPGNRHDRRGEIDSSNTLAIFPKLGRVVVAPTEHQVPLLGLVHNRVDVIGVPAQHLHLIITTCGWWNFFLAVKLAISQVDFPCVHCTYLHIVEVTGEKSQFMICATGCKLKGFWGNYKRSCRTPSNGLNPEMKRWMTCV